MPIKTRIIVLWQIIQSRPALVLFWPLAAIGVYDTFLSQALSEDLAATLPRLRDLFPVTREWTGQTWLLILAAALIVVVFEYAHRLYRKTLPKLVLGRVVHEPDLGSPVLAMKQIKIEVKNTGVETLHKCIVYREDLTSDKAGIHKPRKVALSTETQQTEGRPSAEFTLRPDESEDVSVARFFEGQEREIEFQYEPREFQKKVRSDDTYHFNLVAYSESAPDSKRFKLYVDDSGRLRMEEDSES